MLVLTRKQNERLLIDGGIEIKVLSVQGSRVKLGIEAPAEIGVRRGELESSIEGWQTPSVGTESVPAQPLLET